MYRRGPEKQKLGLLNIANGLLHTEKLYFNDEIDENNSLKKPSVEWLEKVK